MMTYSVDMSHISARLQRSKKITTILNRISQKSPPSLKSIVIRQCFALRLRSSSFDEALDELTEFAATVNRPEIPQTLKLEIFRESVINVIFDLPSDYNILFNSKCKKCHNRCRINEFSILCSFYNASELFCSKCLNPLFVYM